MTNKSTMIIADIDYEVDVSIMLQYINNDIFLDLEIIPVGEDIDDVEDWCLSVNFNTHLSTINELEGKSFIWTTHKNQDGDEAGYFNIQEDFVEKGTIKIDHINERDMTIEWSGEFGSLVNSTSFHSTLVAKIPKKIEYIIDACKGTKIKIGKDSELEILNLQEFNKELLRLSHSIKREKTKLARLFKSRKETFNATLKLRLNIDTIVYYGEITFVDNTRHHTLHFDTHCPKKISFNHISWNTKLSLEKFSFYID